MENTPVRSALSRCAEIHLVLWSLHGEEGLSDTKNIRQIRIKPIGPKDDIGSAGKHLPYLRKSSVNGKMGNRPPTRKRLEDNAA